MIITTTPILEKFEQILVHISQEEKQKLARELAKIVPATPEATIEWEKRLHYEEDETILGGAYLRVFPAKQYEGEMDIHKLLSYFINPNPAAFWEEMQEVLEALATDVKPPIHLKTGLALYITDGMGALMFSFSAPAKQGVLQKLEQQYKHIRHQVEEISK
jgi:hypothetical protein